MSHSQVPPDFEPLSPIRRRRKLLLVSLCVALFFLSAISLQRFVGPLELQPFWSSAYSGPVRVGLQVGHLNSREHPEELARLRLNTGGHWAGVDEVNINLAVAQHLGESLELDGIKVDLLPATIPKGYKADLVLSIHADVSPDESRRGYKSAHFRQPRNSLEPMLKTFIDEAYFYYTGLPDDGNNVSGAMLHYYAFNARRYQHTVDSQTPALIVELGYISNPEDRTFLEDPTNPSFALKRGIMDYLEAQGRLPTVTAENAAED